MKSGYIKRLSELITICWMILLLAFPSALCEQITWDCPECGRKGNTGNFCGGCGSPGPFTGKEISVPTTDYAAKQYKAGDIISFGHYEQDNLPSTEPEEIEWMVLEFDETNRKVLLISRYGLDAKQFNTVYSDMTWEACSLRAWLNNEFLNDAFSTEEQSAIIITEVDNSSDQSYWGTSCDNTRDRIFLLSSTEANQYFGVEYADGGKNTGSRAAPTHHAIADGAWASDDNRTDDGGRAGWWWLRTQAEYPRDAAVVEDDGSLSWYGVHNNMGSVRPALWMNPGSGN